MKNELHVPDRLFLNIKMKNEKPILAVACFLLQMQKPSSKTSFGLNKFYLKIFQILTLLSFIFRFSKSNWKTKIEIMSFYDDLKSTDLLLNYWWIWAACWQYNKTHLSWNDQQTPNLVSSRQWFVISIFSDTISVAGWNIVECEELIKIHQGAFLIK